MFKKFNLFGNTNIKYKLHSIERVIKLNFYSKYGKDKFYFKFIYFIFFLIKSVSSLKKNYSIIFNKEKIKQNIICIIPRSGNNLLRCIFSSYYELNFNLGNGIPKYNILEDKWKFNFDLNYSHELYGATLDNKKVFNPLNLLFTQFPINKVNLIDINNSKPVIVIRNPQDLLISWYIHDTKSKIKSNFDEVLLNKRIKNINYAYSYWEKFMQGKQNNKDYLLIRFEDLIKYTEETLCKIFNFFRIDFNRDILSKAVDLNKLENHKTYINNNLETTIRFSNTKDKYLVETILNKANNKIITSLY